MEYRDRAGAENRNSPASGAFRATAFAKINLYLHIIGRREDGYHLLDSLFAFVTLGDTLTVTPQPSGIHLTSFGAWADSLPAPGDDLVTAAAQALAALAPRRLGARIQLEKNLPVAAGLGGGSADAATTLALLARAWGLDCTADLPALAATLGADVPACLSARPLFAGGIGDEIRPAPQLPAAGILLVNPRKALPTPEVFSHFRASAAHRKDRLARQRPGVFQEPPPDAASLARLLRARANDLTAAATEIIPEITSCLAALADVAGCRLARMSGSGATCFGLFDGEAEARDGAHSLARAHPGWWIAPTRLRP